MTKINNIKAALRLCDYPHWAFKQVEKKVREKKDHLKKKNPKTGSSTQSGKPYVKGLSKVTAQVVKKYARTVSFRPASSIGQ